MKFLFFLAIVPFLLGACSGSPDSASETKAIPIELAPLEIIEGSAIKIEEKLDAAFTQARGAKLCFAKGKLTNKSRKVFVTAWAEDFRDGIENCKKSRVFGILMQEMIAGGYSVYHRGAQRRVAETAKDGKVSSFCSGTKLKLRCHLNITKYSDLPNGERYHHIRISVLGR